jgi:hypothetical protein
MKINQYLVKTACPPSSGTLLPDHRFGVFAKHIARAALLLPVALGATVILATGCSSTGTAFAARLISPVPNNQPATSSEADNWYQPSRSPGFDPDLFGS